MRDTSNRKNAFLSAVKRVKWKHYVNYLVVLIVLLVALILGAGGALKTSTANLLEKVAISVVLAVSLSVVVGFLGELSLGHAGFMCVGAYLGGKVSCLLVPHLGNGIPALILSLLAGGLCAAVCGFLIGLPALRLRGDYLAIVTLAFGEIVKVVFRQSAFFGGNLGLDTPRYDKKTFYIIAFLIVLFTLAITQNLIRSKHGRAITAIRDSEIAARAVGVDVTKYKLVAFILSAFFAGIAGVMFSYTNSTVQAAKFGYSYSIEILVMVVLGGMGNLTGAMISATFITILNTWLPTVLTGDRAIFKDILYALILIVIVIYNNAPALSGFREKYNLRKLREKLFRKPDPSVVTDDEAQWANIPTKIRMDEILSVDLLPQESVQEPDKPERGEKD